ncbi:MAG: dTMP kinase [Paracoccaceae bacterium]
MQIAPRRGFLLTVEGIDGSGKTSQARRVAAWLRDAGHDVVETREPGGSEGAEAIRALLLGGDGARWSAETELLLFTAARRDHVERVLRPALAAGRVVVCDRYLDSTRAYQGADPALRGKIDTLHHLMIGLDPDLTLLFDLAPEAAAARRAARGDADRFETRGLDVDRATRARFLEIAAAEPDRVVVIDADRPEGEVTAAAVACLAPHLPVLAR